jgi:tetratricopeptide (TPR) repeat protein
MKKRVLIVMAALTGAAAFLLAQDATKEPPTVVVPKGKTISAKEAAAIKKISDAKTPDDRIAAVDNLVTNFADTTFKGAALYEAAEAEDQKQDYLKAIVYGDESIEADPKAGTGMNSMLLVAGEIAQHMPKQSLTKDQDLGKAEKYVHQALDMLPTLAKPEGVKISDTDWDDFKKDKTAEAHKDLGLIATARGNMAAAADEYKIAVDTEPTPDAVLMARLGNAYNEVKKYAEAQAVLSKASALPDLDPRVKAFVDQELAKAKKGATGK